MSARHFKRAVQFLRHFKNEPLLPKTHPESGILAAFAYIADVYDNKYKKMKEIHIPCWRLWLFHAKTGLA